MIRIFRLQSIFFYFICFSEITAFAAEVDKKRIWGVDLESGVSLYSGNVTKLTTKQKIQLHKYWKSVFGKIWMEHNYSATGKSPKRIKQQNDGIATARVEFDLYKRWKLFVDSEHSYDQFKKIDYRTIFGLGPSYEIKKERYNMHFSAGFFYEYEKSNEDGIARLARFSLWHMYRRDISEHSEFGYKVQYFPEIGNLHNYRINSSVSILAKILNEALSLKLSVEYDRNNQPLPLVDRDDLRIFSSLIIQFGKKKRYL